MQDELKEKLNQLLHERTGFTEAEAVYFLVESRKLLDRYERDKRFRLLRFYADWSVHTEKDSIKGFETIAQQLAAEPHDRATGSKESAEVEAQLGLVRMTALREEIRTYLCHFGLANPFGNEAAWIAFVANLTSVLQDQPIKNPHEKIEEIRYEPAPQGPVLAIRFSDERGTVRKPIENCTFSGS